MMARKLQEPSDSRRLPSWMGIEAMNLLCFGQCHDDMSDVSRDDLEIKQTGVYPLVYPEPLHRPLPRP